MIVDFTPGQDAFWLAASAFGMTPGSRLDASHFLASASPAATTPDPTILYNTANGNLLFDPDGTGSSGSVLLASLQTIPTLTASDFLLV